VFANFLCYFVYIVASEDLVFVLLCIIQFLSSTHFYKKGKKWPLKNSCFSDFGFGSKNSCIKNFSALFWLRIMFLTEHLKLWSSDSAFWQKKKLPFLNYKEIFFSYIFFFIGNVWFKYGIIHKWRHGLRGEESKFLWQQY
jgi:hypothetical protein